MAVPYRPALAFMIPPFISIVHPLTLPDVLIPPPIAVPFIPPTALIVPPFIIILPCNCFRFAPIPDACAVPVTLRIPSPSTVKIE